MKSVFKTWCAALAAAVALGAAQPAAAAEAQKVLRYSFPIAETGFDPAKIVDLYSRIITSHIFEALYTYDHLARPAKIKPLLAEGMPEASEDFKTFTVKVRRGVFFADDPAFKGRPREVVANDFVYAFKRIADPANKSPVVASVLDMKMIGLKELRDRAIKDKKPFDYDTEIEGLRAIDRYTVQFKLSEPDPRFVQNLAASDLLGAQAREAVEAYGADTAAHPVGTGPFKLVQWRRSSLIVLERNPQYRERLYDAEPAPDDAEGQALLQQFKGRKLPMVDRVEVSIIEESQPRWLAFLNQQLDFLAVPAEFLSQAVPNGKVAPNLAKQGIRAYRTLNADSAFMYFNMDDPVVGGYTPDKIALRRAISLGLDMDRLISVVYRGQALRANAIVVPHTSGFEADFKTENSDYDPARAKALLDLYGYVDRDGDGWRDLPDGRPLVLEYGSEPSQTSRQRDELLRKDMTRLGLNIRFKTAKWPEQLKAARAGKLMMWSLGSSADRPDGQSSLARLYGPQAGSANLAFFKLKEFDDIYDQLSVLPDGPERQELFRRAKMIQVAYAPYKIWVHRILNDVTQPWLTGYRRTQFWQEWWHMVDIDEKRRPPVQ